MAMNHIEIETPQGASKAGLKQWINQMKQLALSLRSQGRLPHRFAPESPRLHPSLEGKFRIEPITIGGKSKEELLRDLGRKHVNIHPHARSMAESAGFTTLKKPQPRELVIGSVGDLVPNPKDFYATTEEIWAARDEKGLEPVPAETALHYLLQKGDQLQLGDAIWMSMKTIAGRDGNPRVFEVVRVDFGLWLFSYWTEPSYIWFPGRRFAFGLPQVTSNT